MNNKRLSVFAVALTMILLLLSVSCVNSAKSNIVKDPPELIEELSESPSYTIIFRQDGYEDVTIKRGKISLLRNRSPLPGTTLRGKITIYRK